MKHSGIDVEEEDEAVVTLNRLQETGYVSIDAANQVDAR